MVTAISVAAMLGRAERQAVLEVPSLDTLLTVFHRITNSLLVKFLDQPFPRLRTKFLDIDSNNSITLSLPQGNKSHNKSHGIREAQKGRQQHR